MDDLLTSMALEPVTLANEHVTLEPLAIKHTSDLVEGLDDDTFIHMPMRSRVRTPSEVRRYIEFQTSRPDTIAFAVLEPSGRAIGSTSYMSIRAEHRSVEIGSTWIEQRARGTNINPAMKRLLLAHAFDKRGAIRVELKTDARNARSRAAILKLSAIEEGTLRHHMIMPDGALRDTVVYAITRNDWPAVRERLDSRLGA